MSGLKPRFNQHEILNSVVRKDWIPAIEQHPDSFQALLYLPVEVNQIVDASKEVPLFNQLDDNQQTLSYSDPIVVSVIDSPEDMKPPVTESGDSIAEDFEDPMMLRIGHEKVPVGAILEWEELMGSNGNTRRVWWYIHSAISVGTTLAGVIYNVIPCRDFEGVK